MSVIARAAILARMSHRGQFRKYTLDPYIVHPEEVAQIVSQAGADDDTIAAAWLHDTIEDEHVTKSGITPQEIEVVCNETVRQLVMEVTDIAEQYDADGKKQNRAKRVGINRDHLARSSPRGATIKLADFISNTRSIVLHDPNFAVRYLQEKAEALQVLKHGNPELWRRAADVLHVAA